MISLCQYMKRVYNIGETSASKCSYFDLPLQCYLSVSTVGKCSTATLSIRVELPPRIRLLAISLLAFQLQAAASCTECPGFDSRSRHPLS